MVVGASGQIGSYIFAELKRQDKYETLGTYFQSSPSDSLIPLDLTNPATYGNLGTLGPEDTVILLSAIAKPQSVHLHQSKAEQVNLVATKKFLEYICRFKVKLLFFSSVEVFDGTHAPHKEEDDRSPLNLYGLQKANIEAFLQSLESNLRFKIIRLPWNISPKLGCHCVVENTYRLILTRSAKFASDYMSSAVSVFDSAHITRLILENFDTLKNDIFHIASNEIFSRFEMACFIQNRSELLGNFDIEKISFSELQLSEPRSQHASLSNARVKQVFDYEFESIWPHVERKVVLLDGYFKHNHPNT